MNYTNFTFEALVASLCGERGYIPYLDNCGEEDHRIKSSDMAIISPTTVEESEGHDRCRITSLVSFTLVKNTYGASQVMKTEFWGDVRRSAVEVVCDIRRSPYVVDVTELEITPLLRKGANLGEVAVLVEATVVSNYDVALGSRQLV